LEPASEAALEPASEAAADREPDELTARFDALSRKGLERWAGAELRYLRKTAGFRDRAQLLARLDALSAAFDATAAAVRVHLDDPRFDEDTREDLRAAFERGDLHGVEILASTRPRQSSSSPLKQAFLEKIRARAEAAGVGIGGEGSGLASALLSASAIEARAAAIVAEARELDLESVGPYNPWALSLRIFARLDEVGPGYLAAWVGFLEDVAMLRPPPPPETKPKAKARSKPKAKRR
jgi:hypothetical protein